MRTSTYTAFFFGELHNLNMEIEKDLPKDLNMPYLISCVESVQDSCESDTLFALVVNDISEEDFENWVEQGVWKDTISSEISNAVRNFSSSIGMQMAA